MRRGLGLRSRGVGTGCRPPLRMEAAAANARWTLAPVACSAAAARPRWIVLAMLAVRLGLAPLEAAVVARASQVRHPAAAGYLLAVLSVGSATGGLVWDRLAARRRP